MKKLNKYNEYFNKENNIEVNTDDNDKDPNYMVIQNLKSIMQKSKEMLNMLDGELDEWAKDHIATSNDDVTEVYEFLKNKK